MKTALTNVFYSLRLPENKKPKGKELLEDSYKKCRKRGSFSLNFNLVLCLRLSNKTNMSSFHPLASHSPGVVTVEVVSSTGSYLGQTLFKYIDVVDNILKELEHNEELHRRFFQLMAQEVRNALRNPEKLQPSPAIPGFKTPGMCALYEELGLF